MILQRLTFIHGMLSMMLFSLIRLIKQYPEPLSVIVKPRASFVLAISISFGRPKKNKNTILYILVLSVNYKCTYLN